MRGHIVALKISFSSMSGNCLSDEEIELIITYVQEIKLHVEFIQRKKYLKNQENTFFISFATIYDTSKLSEDNVE